MDEGAQIAWPERFNHDELSAIQHAMNLKLQDEAAFFAEYQNEPLPEVKASDNELSTDQIAAKLNRIERQLIPIGANHLTMFVDVQATLLFYSVIAWEDDFTGYLVDYGTYPDQRRPYFTLRDARATLAIATKAGGLEGCIYAGLERLTADCLTREWRRDDGAMLRIEKCLIDANWGSSTDVVYQFCRQSQFAGIVMPSHGRFVGASSQARGLRHQLLEDIHPRTIGSSDGRSRLPVTLRRNTGNASAVGRTPIGRVSSSNRGTRTNRRRMEAKT
jgi:phage terminase large subunit GpA-like protein